MPSCPPKWIHFLEKGSKAPEPSQPKRGAGCLSVGLCLTHSLTGCVDQSAPRETSERRRMHRLMVHQPACNPKEAPVGRVQQIVRRNQVLRYLACTLCRKPYDGRSFSPF